MRVMEKDPEIRIAELEAEVARLRAIVEEPEYVPYVPVDPEELREQLRAKGMTVGTLTGPPIKGTTDTVNSGPPRIKKSAG